MFSSSISDQPSDLCVAPLLALLSMLMFSRGNFFFKPIRVNKGTRTGCGVIVFRGDGFFYFIFSVLVLICWDLRECLQCGEYFTALPLT